MSDWELLQQYVRERSQEAFGEIVRRHLNLVYSTAHRVVRAPQLAEEVSQSAFVALAQHAARLRPGTPLVAWLHVVTRRSAIDLLRRETSRQARELATADLNSVPSQETDWSAIAPLLDEAVASLREADRSAILLRYFENKSLREVGEALGLSEDNAQKRVSRTLERLRQFLTSRGITVTAGSLASTLAARAIETAPAALAGTILRSSLLVPSLAGSSILFSTAMTSFSKLFLTAAAVAVLAGGAYEVTVIVRLRRELADLTARNTLLAARNITLEHEATAARTTAGPRAAAPAETPERIAAEAAVEAWISRLLEFKRRAAEMKERSIPEMQFLTDQDWIDCLYRADLTTEMGLRKALSVLRARAKQYVTPKIQESLAAYKKANGGKLPTDINQLAPFFAPPLDPAILQRYEAIATEPMGSPIKLTMATVWEKAPVDEYYDTLLRIGDRMTGQEAMTPKDKVVAQALKQFKDSHSGAIPTVEEIGPYLSESVDESFLRERLASYRRNQD